VPRDFAGWTPHEPGCAARVAWPDLGGRVEAEFNALPAKTKEYFRRRGLWAADAESH